MYRLKSLKEKTLSLRVNCLGRKAYKNSARCLKANTNFVYCTINATVERILIHEKIVITHVKRGGCLFHSLN